MDNKCKLHLKDGYIFHLEDTQQIPGQLKFLIEYVNVPKFGRCVKQDLVKLEAADYGVNRSSYHPNAFLDLGSQYMELGYTDSLTKWSMQRLCRDALGKYLPKPASVRCGDWEDCRFGCNPKRVFCHGCLRFSRPF
ncbi:hypothetical protein [Parasitella parasitica]|uniref:3'-5' exonuclease domain-containing protein n=1 Tax=Parasitella parasitica TaxID=35722 RepID=A0A0B7NS34_9FUNG|nr:hypothetical protein [Parasitella parasitica]